MGVVHLASDLLLGRGVALKRPTDECARNPDLRRLRRVLESVDSPGAGASARSAGIRRLVM